MTDIKLDYDTEASGPFTEGEILTFGGGGTAELVMLYDNGTEGEMYASMISGAVPADNESITGGTSLATANVNGTPFNSRFPVKIREDISKNAADDIRWTGPALGTTHSCIYVGQATGPFVVGEILTFGNGSTAELVALTDNGTDGELFVRMISPALPGDNDTITGGTSGATANVNGAFHQRAYEPNHIHYWFSDKGDDAVFTGDDVHDRTRPQISRRVGVTDVRLLGSANIDDALSYHLYGGSITQGAGGSETEYNAVDISVVDADGATVPVIIQNFALLSATTTDYWKNAYMPNDASRIRILVKVKVTGTVTDRRVVRFRALEFLRQYFTAPDPTLSGGITPVSLVATDDGNNTSLEATVATWTDALIAYGFAQVDHNNGNGLAPYWGVGDLGTRTKGQFHERQKWVQRRGTSETILGHNAQLIVGNDLTFQYDTEAGGPFTEGEILTFGNGGTAVLLALDDQGTTGTMYCQRATGDVPADNATISGGTSAATAIINGTPTTRLIINNLFGTFTGAAFNPANVGLTLEAADATAADLFTDLAGNQQQPPNNQAGVVNTSAGNTIIIGPWDGSTVDAQGNAVIDWDFFTLATALTGAAETAIALNEAIPSWVPQDTYLRVTTNGGARRLIQAVSWSGSTIVIPSTDFSGDNASIGNGVAPTPIDEVAVSSQTSFTGIYSSDQQMAGTVLNGSGAQAKQPFPFNTTFGSGGFSVNVSLQDD